MKALYSLFFFFLCINLSAQDCIEYEYYRNISIENTSANTLTDYQVSIQLNTSELVANGKLRADGADIRVFLDDCSPLPFWGDSLGTSIVTNVWVKIPSIPANSTRMMQIYYGNPSAESVVDGNNTFIFFDEFNDQTVDLTKWEPVGEYATLAIVDSILNYSSTSHFPGSRFKFVRTVSSFSEQIIFDFVATRTNTNGFGFSSGDNPLDRILFRNSGFGFDTLNQIAYMSDTISNGIQVESLYPLLRFEKDVFNTASITSKINASNHLEINHFANLGLEIENIDAYEFVQAEMSSFHFILSSFDATNTIFLDNIRVRQFTPTPPTIMVGQEILIAPNNVQTLIDPRLIQVFPNPANQFSIVKIDSEEPVYFEILNTSGQRVKAPINHLGKGTSQRLDLQGMTNGVYYLNFYRSSDQLLLHSKVLNVVR